MTNSSQQMQAAIAAYQEGLRDQAEALARRVLDVDPLNLHALTLLGSILCETGQRADGLAHLARAFDLAAHDATVALAYGKALREEEKFTEAEAVLAKAAELAPEDGGILAEHGMSLRDLMRLDEAEARLRAAVALPSGGPRKYAGLGLILFETGRPDESAAFMSQAAKLIPDDPEILTHLALALQDLGRAFEAESLFRRVLELAPQGDHEEARRQRGVYTGNLALNLLSLGKIAEGWDLFEARAAFPNWKRSQRRYPAPLWSGQRYDGQTLLAWREQGLGDEIRMGSCVRQLAQLGGQLVLDCDSRLEALYRRSFPDISVREAGPHGDLKFDLHVPIASLPRFFRRRLEDFPGPVAYLKPDPILVEKWQARLAALPGKIKAGICWKTGVTASHRLWNISSLESWRPLLSMQDVAFVNLQYGDCEEELRAAEAAQGITVHRWPDLDLRNDLENIVALIKALDLVITVGTAVNDLAGSVGCDTWLILKTPHYDMMGTDRYPWYPATRVFPRPWNLDWSRAMARVAMAMRERLGEESGRNASCPCGSGKRFKHCCGAEGL
ncbi:MAG: tetratricopeptide repeat protein [Alphaproteobacteria bacterium]|nr:tetratricopeptide repeat protein [Alphaproteobacteria bacterium]